ncbi:MAG: hypothetical protein ACXW3E_13885 [Thermoanaerobaculia bacterium]
MPYRALAPPATPTWPPRTSPGADGICATGRGTISQFGSLTGVTELDAAIVDPLISQMALSPILRR